MHGPELGLKQTQHKPTAYGTTASSTGKRTEPALVGGQAILWVSFLGTPWTSGNSYITQNSPRALGAVYPQAQQLNRVGK